MKKIILTLIIGVVLGIGTYLLLTNSHADFFGANYEAAIALDEYTDCSTSTPKETISLMYLEEYYDQCYNYSLSASGWMMAVFVIGILPLLIGFGISSLVFKKKK